MNIYKIVVNFHDNQKDYVSATVYYNDMLWGVLDDIAKPENVYDYTIKWKNGLINHYSNMLKNKLPNGATIITM